MLIARCVLPVILFILLHSTECYGFRRIPRCRGTALKAHRPLAYGRPSRPLTALGCKARSTLMNSEHSVNEASGRSDGLLAGMWSAIKAVFGKTRPAQMEEAEPSSSAGLPTMTVEEPVIEVVTESALPTADLSDERWAKAVPSKAPKTTTKTTKTKAKCNWAKGHVPMPVGPPERPDSHLRQLLASLTAEQEDRSSWDKRIQHVASAPQKRCVELQYDHLASSSLLAVTVDGQPACPHTSIKHWWMAAKKWNLLTGDWLLLDQLLDYCDLEQRVRQLLGTGMLMPSANGEGKDQGMNAGPLIGEAFDDFVHELIDTEIRQCFRSKSILLPAVPADQLPGIVKHFNVALMDAHNLSAVASNHFVAVFNDLLPWDGGQRSQILDKALYKAVTHLSKCRAAKIIAIGDVHGCVSEVMDLLREAEYSPGDQIVFLGDLVGKGPFSSLAVQLAMDTQALSARGNHEQKVIEEAKQAASGWQRNLTGHMNIALDLTSGQYEYVSEMPYYIQSDDLAAVFVHAGLNISLPLDQQPPQVMMSMRCPEGGDKTQQAVADNANTEGAQHVHRRFSWAEHWTGPWKVMFGHDAARKVKEYPHAVCMDSSCVYGNELSAMLLPEEVVVSVPAIRMYKKK